MRRKGIVALALLPLMLFLGCATESESQAAAVAGVEIPQIMEPVAFSVTPSLAAEPTVEVMPPSSEPVEETEEPEEKGKSFAELAPTTVMTFEELVGDNGNHRDVERYPPAERYKIVIDIYHQVVLAYSRDDAGEYTVPERYMVCTSGGGANPTPAGDFTAGTHRPRFGKFVNDGVYGQYWTQIYGRIYFHSLLYSQRSASTYTTSSYRLLGKRGSHGCVRLLVPDARWVYYNVAPGAQIEIRRGSSEDTETAAIKEQLVRASLPSSRPSIKAGSLPDTDVWSIEELEEELSGAVEYVLPDGTQIKPWIKERPYNAWE